jgi:hypothetical protein
VNDTWLYIVGLALFSTSAIGFGVLTYALATAKSPAAHRFLILPAIFALLFGLSVVIAIVRGPQPPRNPYSWRTSANIAIFLGIDLATWYLAFYFLGRVNGGRR